jgi:hypothetical protein
MIYNSHRRFSREAVNMYMLAGKRSKYVSSIFGLVSNIWIIAIAYVGQVYG